MPEIVKLKRHVRQPEILSTWLSVDAEECLIIAMTIQTLRADAPLPTKWEEGMSAIDRLAWKLRDLVPGLVRKLEEQEDED